MEDIILRYLISKSVTIQAQTFAFLERVESVAIAAAAEVNEFRTVVAVRVKVVFHF